jgi:predicted phage terminase large subunit-like protein
VNNIPVSFAAVDAELARRRFSHFIRCAWESIEPGNHLGWNWHLDAICEFLEAVSAGEIPNGVITIPPRTLKSRLITVMWPVWEWTSRPATKFITASYAANLALDHSVQSRDLIRSEYYQSAFGDRFKLAGDQNVKGYYKNDRGGHRVATSVGGSATGWGADIIIADDPINVKEANSELVRAAALEWWRKVMPSRLNDPRTGRKLVVMQRVHEDDVAAWCIDNGYQHLNLPMEYDPKSACIVPAIGWTDPRTEPGELLHVERYGVEQVEMLKRELGSFAFEAQYNQQPRPVDDNAIFPANQWSVWDALPSGPDGLRKPDDTLISADLTFTGKQQRSTGGYTNPDHVVYQLWYMYGADRYLIDEARGQWSFTQSKQQLRAFVDRAEASHPFPASRVIVEAKANGEALIDDLRGEIPGIVGWNPDKFGDKVQRAWAAQPLQEAGQLWLPKRASWLDDWRSELAAFPHGRWDDRVDAMSMAQIALNAGLRRWGVA